MRILLCIALILFAIKVSSAQTEPYSIGQINVALGSTHLFQSEWQPYQDQFTIDFDYILNTIDQELLMDFGFSWSFAKYKCPTCTTAPADSFDGMIYIFKVGVGKWWRNEKTSAAITGGLLGSFSQYHQYTYTVAGAPTNKVEFSNRGHAGLYIRTAVDFRMNDRGLRLGPFLESRISTGATDKDLYLNVSSFAVGLYLGWRQENL